MLHSAQKEDDAALQILQEARQHLAGLEGTGMTESIDTPSRALKSRREIAMKTEQNKQPSKVAGRLKKSNSNTSLSTTGSKEHTSSSRKKKSSKKLKSSISKDFNSSMQSISKDFNSSMESINDFRKLLSQPSAVFGRQSTV